jgi:hypothetical protein
MVDLFLQVHGMVQKEAHRAFPGFPCVMGEIMKLWQGAINFI